MLIRCTIERNGGTEVKMDGKTYLFAPKDSNGPHVCEVSEVAHVSRFMAIPESFEPVTPPKVTPPKVAEKPKPVTKAKKSVAAKKTA